MAITKLREELYEREGEDLVCEECNEMLEPQEAFTCDECSKELCTEHINDHGC